MTWRSNLRMPVVVSIVLMAFVSPAAAKFIYVDANAPGPTHDGSSWTNAYKYLQDALTDANSALKPIEIRVAEGIYTPDSNSADPNGSGDRTATFQLINSVSLKGSYAGFSETEPNDRDIELYETILSGDLNGDDIDVTNPLDLVYDFSRYENSYHVVTAGGTDATAVLDGFIITGGNGNRYGGGILGNGATTTITNCKITGNVANRPFLGNNLGYGGGLSECNGSITNCNITGNVATSQGGGLYNCDGPITNCTITGNVAYNYNPTTLSAVGGGLYGCDSSITNCIISDNFLGGGLINCNGPINSCTIAGNSSGLGECDGPISNCTINDNDGPGIAYCEGSITKCTISNNTSRSTAGISGFSGIIADCIISHNTSLTSGAGGLAGCSGPIINCIITGNRAEGDLYGKGGGLSYYNSSPILINCVISYNSASIGGAIYGQGGIADAKLVNCILWNNTANAGPQIALKTSSAITISHCDLEGGQAAIFFVDETPTINWGDGNIDADPYFADSNNGDYHLKSQAGRWDANSESWIMDYVSSPCIDAGNPGCPMGDEPSPNGNRRNMGAYGGTAEASKSPTYWRSIADTTNDWIVDSNDLKVFVGYWLQTGECIPSDFDRSQFVDFNDFAILGGQWSQKGPGPGITYDIGGCIPVDFPSSTTEEPNETRFTVTVEGQYILFEDMMQANCCPEELDVQMTLEDNLITIYEIERFFTRVPCPCICDYPITATFGPFEPGTYSLVVYQKSSFIGSTAVTIEYGQ